MTLLYVFIFPVTLFCRPSVVSAVSYAKYFVVASRSASSHSISEQWPHFTRSLVHSKCSLRPNRGPSSVNGDKKKLRKKLQKIRDKVTPSFQTNLELLRLWGFHAESLSPVDRKSLSKSRPSSMLRYR